MSKQAEPQAILDATRRLLLPSGVSPDFDVVIPKKFLRGNPSFTLRLNGYGEWHLNAREIAEEITAFEERLRKTQDGRTVDTTAYGRSFKVKRMAPLVQHPSTRMKLLADFLFKNVPPHAHQERIMRLFQFVQDLPYSWENDTNIDRPGLLTLLNGGGDCNNVTMLFAELMLAAGYDVAIMHSDGRDEDYITHTRGGLPRTHFPDAPHWWWNNETPKEHWVHIELAGDRSWKPGFPTMGPKETETIFMIEVLRASEHRVPN